MGSFGKKIGRRIGRGNTGFIGHYEYINKKRIKLVLNCEKKLRNFYMSTISYFGMNSTSLYEAQQSWTKYHIRKKNLNQTTHISLNLLEIKIINLQIDLLRRQIAQVRLNKN